MVNQPHTASLRVDGAGGQDIVCPTSRTSSSSPFLGVPQAHSVQGTCCCCCSSSLASRLPPPCAYTCYDPYGGCCWMGCEEDVLRRHTNQTSQTPMSIITVTWAPSSSSSSSSRAQPKQP
ncbi:hypothetical protein TEQG_06798 [Trichophyton equinum CBS 127.97]|uniref:Uncharacterized protein n=1 Tax=Trichophyton equinum (strain ATCC MYA-4606 / CBS 127.97) TaxID=559882 RepID=F2Q0U8_TRIEC|nr:hypothetical protein TEQG_06798 [Trichophyton equinum CBS 127.97]